MALRHLDCGVFIPIANNGWLISTTAPQYMPSFAHNKEITLRAEQWGYEFVLSMVKFRGYGGQTQFWDHALESFTLMAGLAAVTERIGLFASIAIPTIHPAIVARMAATLDDISNGRFGINIVSGWNKLEYTQMGLWPGDDYYGHRYDYATEYVEILKALWQQGRATYKGRFFQLEDCLCQPKPSHEIPIVCAGQSDRGVSFTVNLGDYNFVVGDIPSLAEMSGRVKHKAAEAGRQVGTYALHTVVIGETDQAAQAQAQYIRDGGDVEALQGWTGAAATDPSGETVKKLQGHAFMGIPTVVGSYDTVAAYFDRLAQESQVDGVLLTFPDFVADVSTFGQQVMPRMQCRQVTSYETALF